MTEEPGAGVEVLPREAQRALAWWRPNPMLPASYKRKDGTLDVDGMERAAWLLVRLHIPVIEALGDTFVIKDQVGFKADLQRAILTRPGTGYDFEVLELDDEHCTARLQTPTGWKPALTKRITDNDIRVYAERNETNYGEKPARMLLARVSTLLIDTYAKGVIRGWVAEAGFAYAEEVDQPDREYREDGSTIPEHQRQPVCPEELRLELLARVDRLRARAPDRVAALATQLGEDRVPNMRARNPEFKRAHARLVDLLLAEIEADLDPAEATPERVHDDAPEARGFTPDDAPDAA